MLTWKNENEFELCVNGCVVLKHSEVDPCIFLGQGKETIEMYRGNFNIEDYVTERVALPFAKVVKEESNACVIELRQHLFDLNPLLILHWSENNKEAVLAFEYIETKHNRFWIRLHADKEEKVYGCGEQMSYFNLRGKNFPIWTSEPGVGRDKSTYVTWKADVLDKAGGDYYTSNYPEPSFISTRKYWCHVDSTAYADFNFKPANFHELEIWEIPTKILFVKEDSYLSLIEALTVHTGRLPQLPDWVNEGVMLGVQGGTETVLGYLEQAKEQGVEVTGLWCQDWQGINMTSFGKRLRWNWMWNETLYPQLDTLIHELKAQNIRFMGYINPYVVEGGSLYAVAEKENYLAKNADGKNYSVDFGEFYCGIIDLTNTAAFNWYKSVIRKNMIDFGLDGWMADFGEYLPSDCILSNGIDAKIMHNDWPRLWAKCNYEALQEAGKLGEVLYFMRAGGYGTQKYCTSLWAGDQSVDFTLHDGLASVITGALSSGIMGNPYHHSDIGGYTSLHGNIRTKELFERWAEMAVFTSFMRSHEGNRPNENFQFYHNDETMKHLGIMSKIHKSLKPYIRKLVEEGSLKGIPMQRPLFLHYEGDALAYTLPYEYLFGQDILVAPVYQSEVDILAVYLPQDTWVHFWTGKTYIGGTHPIKVPIGYPAAFYRKESLYRELFETVGKMNYLGE
jgi:sulfoquinovosidase